MASSQQTEPFPEFIPLVNAVECSRDDALPPAVHHDNLPISPSTASRTRQSRGQSLIHNVLRGDTPLGVWQAIGETGSKIPTLSEIHDGSYGDDGWSEAGQLERRGTDLHKTNTRTSRRRRSSETMRAAGGEAIKAAPIKAQSRSGFLQKLSLINRKAGDQQQLKSQTHSSTAQYTPKTIHIIDTTSPPEGPDRDGFYSNGYRFPEKHTWLQSITIASKRFWKFFITLKGFLFTIYCLNVVGWGAMIFFVLVEAAPAMCRPSCNDKYSPRKVWIEIDAQVLTALFCIPAFGLIPRRFRDFYLLAKWRLGGDMKSHRKLAGIYRSWYRLPRSNALTPTLGPLHAKVENQPQSDGGAQVWSTESLRSLLDDPAIPLPSHKIPDAPLTGIRAPPTKSWNLDIVIWMYMLNTWIQGALCGIMWGMNRFTRPSWATGFLISIGCITGIIGGFVEFTRGSKVKKVEGIPVNNKESDIEENAGEYRSRKPIHDVKSAKQQVRQVGTNVTGVS